MALTEILAEVALAPQLGDGREVSLAAAGRAFADTVGVALAASDEESVHAALGFAGQTFAGSGVTASLIAPGHAAASGLRLSPAGAALVNGVASHALDYDDVSPILKGHLSAVVVPTVLAVADAFDLTGLAAAEAYVAGFDVACAVASGLGIDEHYLKGWHATSTVGVLGATAAAARLRGLSVDEAAHGLGIAASTAAGLRGNFGSTTKHLHVGLAAAHAIFAVDLALNGATAAATAIEGTLGYLAVFGGADAAAERIAAAAASEPGWSALQVNVKKYPCCYHSHRTIDALLAIRDQISRADVQSITATTEPGGSASLIHHDARTAAHARFSGEFALATALLDGCITFQSFSERARSRPEVARLMKLTSFRESARPPVGPEFPTDGYGTVRVALADGRELMSRVDIPHGDHRDQLSDGEYSGKFDDCVAFGSRRVDDQLFGDLCDLAHQPSVRDILKRLSS